ncbi:MAG: diaminopimelate epimerase [Pseudomonadales bacterium]|nr:diaminopimelate epimerase [Pseudomonadales bacterium]
MLLRFTKMHGLGNDFVLLDLISQNVQIRENQIQELADRRLGIGFDQLLIVEPPTNPDMDFRYRIFNADGSEAEQCGNGARCFMRFVRDRGLTTKTELKLETNTGSIECKLEKDGNVTVNMGKPVLRPEDIPFIADEPGIHYPLEFRESLCQPMTRTCISAVNMGNPHAVIQVDDVDSAPVSKWGPAIESHERFPRRVNVGFMQVVDKNNIRLRVFERGVGETRACGTGACAAVVAGRLQGLLEEHVTVSLPGGELQVSWAGDKAPVYLTGPACRTYEGRLHI